MNTERLIVAKFGGTSLANAERFILVANIINGDPRRRIIVPSAPGKDKNRSKKITDLLIRCGRLSFKNLSFNRTFGVIERRFLDIAEGLEVCIDEDLEQLRNGFLVKRETRELSIQWAASRGEWLSGKILARCLGVEFVDAVEVMRFNNDGTFNEEKSYSLMTERLRGSQRFVVPGFYGQDAAGRIRTFPRGGSDITGAYLAAGLHADLYENWTDTNGVLTADPNIVPEAQTIRDLLYEEMTELACSGARVLHSSALGSVWIEGIPINVRNTFNLKDSGTRINGTTSYWGIQLPT